MVYYVLLGEARERGRVGRSGVLTPVLDVVHQQYVVLS